MAGLILKYDNIFKSLFVITVISTVMNLSECKTSIKIPSYIHLCKKNEANLDQCLLQIFESIKPKFDTGIPEMGIPPLDPLFLPQIVIFNGERGEVKVIANNVKATGAKDMKIHSLKLDLEKYELDVRVFFPVLHFEGTYDVNAKFVNFPLKGKGPMRGNATDVTADAHMKGKIVTIDGTRYLEMESAKVHVGLKGYGIRVEKLFPDKKLNEAINRIMNDPNVVAISTVRPLMDKVAAKMLIDMVNKISKRIPFDELFSP